MTVIDVPAHVQLSESRTQNNVSVRGGSNWDITRGTIATPIVAEVVEEVRRSPYAMGPRPATILDRTPYTIHHEMPVGMDPDRTVYFDKNKEALTADAKSLLRTIPKGSEVILAGHSDSRETNTPTITEKRLDQVAKLLEDHGVKVEKRHNFGAKLQLSEEGKYSEVNRRVEVFVR